MQVLKFGGTSVANAVNMQKVVDIVAGAVDKDRTILVCSAISGCTDTLIKIGHLASEKDDSYKDLITKHKDLKSLAPLFDLIDSKTEGGDGKIDKSELDLLQKALNHLKSNSKYFMDNFIISNYKEVKQWK